MVVVPVTNLLTKTGGTDTLSFFSSCGVILTKEISHLFLTDLFFLLYINVDLLLLERYLPLFRPDCSACGSHDQSHNPHNDQCSIVLIAIVR